MTRYSTPPGPSLAMPRSILQQGRHRQKQQQRPLGRPQLIVQQSAAGAGPEQWQQRAGTRHTTATAGCRAIGGRGSCGGVGSQAPQQRAGARAWQRGGAGPGAAGLPAAAGLQVRSCLVFARFGVWCVLSHVRVCACVFGCIFWGEGACAGECMRMYVRRHVCVCARVCICVCACVVRMFLCAYACLHL